MGTLGGLAIRADVRALASGVAIDLVMPMNNRLNSVAMALLLGSVRGPQSSSATVLH